MNYVSYSFVPYDTLIKFGDDYYFQNDFINHDNFIFEFLLKLRCESTVYTDDIQNAINSCKFDTIAVYVYDLTLKKYHSVWPFDSSFVVVEKNKLPAQKETGFKFHITKTEKQSQEKALFKYELVFGKKLAYTYQEDSVTQQKVFFVQKEELNSPYDFFITNPKNYDYSPIGYNVKDKRNNFNFGSVIKDIKQVDDSTKKLCNKIVQTIKNL